MARNKSSKPTDVEPVGEMSLDKEGCMDFESIRTDMEYNGNVYSQSTVDKLTQHIEEQAIGAKNIAKEADDKIDALQSQLDEAVGLLGDALYDSYGICNSCRHKKHTKDCSNKVAITFLATIKKGKQ